MKFQYDFYTDTNKQHQGNRIERPVGRFFITKKKGEIMAMQRVLEAAGELSPPEAKARLEEIRRELEAEGKDFNKTYRDSVQEYCKAVKSGDRSTPGYLLYVEITNLDLVIAKTYDHFPEPVMEEPLELPSDESAVRLQMI